MRLFFPLSLVALLASCGSTEPTADSVLAAMEQSRYVKPATISAKVTNNSSESLFWNQCLRFQRLEGDTWVDVPPESLCPALRAELRAGSIGGASGYLSTGASAGEYRGVTELDTEAAESLVVVTNAFTLQ